MANTNTRAKSAEEYILRELYKTQDELEVAKKHVHTLEEDINAYEEDFLKIKDHFKIEFNSNKTEFALYFYRDPSASFSSEILAFSGSTNPDLFRPNFKAMISLLKLEEVVDRLIGELKNEDNQGSRQD